MKILVLCYEYPPVGGGGGRVAQSLAEELASRGHQVRVQTAGMSHLPAREIIGNVAIFRSQSFRRREDTCAVHEMGLFVLTSFLPTLRHIRQWKPDVVHAHFAVPTGLLAWAVHALTGIPYVLTAHLGDVPGGVPEQTGTLFKLIDPIARRIWNKAAAATAVSSFVQELAERAYGRPVTRILNGIDLTGAAPEAPATVGLPPRMVFVGRFNPQKNTPFLIDALSRIAELPWTLTMIGDGPDMAAVRERLTRYALSSRVTLTGWLRTPEVQQVLANADLLCMPSTSEGMPVAAVEALRNGVAIVASDIPGVRDVVAHELNGALSPLNDVEAFARVLRRILTDPARLLAMKQASWQKARDFDLKKIAVEYEHILAAAAIPAP
ncbi:MAG: glycosyltransferase family 4 protein [Verrucomicrobiota bacterium]